MKPKRSGHAIEIQSMQKNTKNKDNGEGLTVVHKRKNKKKRS